MDAINLDANQMKPIGRPPTLKSATRRNIYIPDALWEYASTIGSGSSAEGIRIALKAYKHHANGIAVQVAEKHNQE